MKKALPVIMSVLLLFGFVVPAQASSDLLQAEFEAVEFSEKQIEALTHGKNKTESADSILSYLGMSEDFAENIPSDKKEQIPDALRAYKISEKDNETEADSPLRKNMWIFELGSGKYLIFGTLEYKYMPFWRGTDVFLVSGYDLVFSHRDFSVTAFYNETTVDSGKTECKKTVVNYDENKFGGFNRILCSGNLPNDITAPSFDGNGGGASVKYSDLAFLVIASASVSMPDLSHTVTVNLSYSHQCMGIGSEGISFDMEDDSPASPRIFFKTHRIKTGTPIEYDP